MTDDRLNAIVTQRIEITPQLIKLRVVPEGWELPAFTAGQYSIMGLPASAPRTVLAEPEDPLPTTTDKLIRRAYSVASSSVAHAYLEFYVGLVHAGALSPRLFALRPGDHLFLGENLRGMFTLQEVPTDKNVVLAATGTGVAPYMSMIRTEIEGGLRHRFAVIHGACHSVDLGYNSELTALNCLSDSFTYLPILSHAKDEPTPWRGHEGFVQRLWTDGILEQEWGFKPTPAETHVFLCGNPFMIRDMIALLTADGFAEHEKDSPGQIHSEQYFVKF
jgi:ferredoxin--NADP+ reductase